MITCPACGKENEDSAFECRRCRAPLRDEVPEEHAAEPPLEAAADEPAQESLGEVCRRCETFNEPGVRICTNCGYQLFAEAAAEAPAHESQGGAEGYTPAHEEVPAEASMSLSQELSVLALSDQEAAEAGMSSGADGEQPADKTPPDAWPVQVESEPEPEPAPARGKVAEVAAAAAGAAGVAVGAAIGAVAATRRASAAEPPAPQPSRTRAAQPAPAPAEKVCANCGAANPPAAKFCFDCGTPFAKKAPAAAEPPKAPEPVRAAPPPPPKAVRNEPPPSIQIDPELTAESTPVALDDALPEEQGFAAAPAEEALPEDEVPTGESVPEEALAAEALPEEEPPPEPVAEEAPPPFQASLVVEKGTAQGTTFVLAHHENAIGIGGAHVELSEDPFVAPHAATLVFADDHLVLRDEGSANGVFVKVRESAPLEPGDLFIAGERLLRFDGPTEIAGNSHGDTPFLGAPRPQGTAVRVSEVLAGGKTGRTCHRSGAVTIGRTGCDMNFPADALLAARHAEVRVAEDGAATLVDLGAGTSGVFLRLRSHAQHDLQPGDLLMVGDQQLRLEVT